MKLRNSNIKHNTAWGENTMSEKFIMESLKTPVRFEVDTVVCGGGTAGVTAALASARGGAKTLLIERYGFVGGTMLNGAGPIHSFFNLYKAFPGAKEQQVVKGIAQEIIDRMMELGASPGHLEMSRGGNYDSRITLIDWETYKDLALRMLEEAGVTILLHTMVTSAIKEGNRVTGVVIEGKSGREAILAHTVIDTTGDGDVAAFAGAEYIKKHDTTSVGYPFGMMNVDMPRLLNYLEENDMVTQLVRADKGSTRDDVVRLGFELKKHPAFTDFMNKYGMWGPLGFSLHEFNYTYINSCNIRHVDATDTLILSNAEITLRHQANELASMLRKHIPGFENAYLYWTPVSAGVRYTRCIVCEHDMTIDEIVNCARFEDELMLYGFHDSAPRIMIKDAGWYGIPYRAFIPKGLDGILVAGRMITSEFPAHMSTRNTGSCLAQGQAVGAAAAIAAKEKKSVREIDVQKVRSLLKEQGVWLDDEKA